MHYILIENRVFGLAIRVFTPSFIVRRLGKLLFYLMQKVMSKVHVNIIASLIINLTAVVLSAAGILTPVTGALWHNCGSVFVVVNAVLLLRLSDQGADYRVGNEAFDTGCRPLVC